MVQPSVEAPAAEKQSLDGYWLSDGYGYLAEIRGDEIKLQEITPVSCIPSGILMLQAEPVDPRGTRFVSKESEFFSCPRAPLRIRNGFIFRARPQRFSFAARVNGRKPVRAKLLTIR
jgi:hypothetical protein